ncbi:MAG: HEAT repeat domain-containing protein [Bacteroidales bacterium]
MMNCEEVQLQLTDFIDNKLDKAKVAEIELHLVSCKKCMQEYNDMKNIIGDLNHYKLKMPDESIRENFNAMLQSEIEKLELQKTGNQQIERKSLLLNPTSPMLKIAAGFAILITGVLIGWNLKPGSDNNQAAQYNDLKKEVKEMKELVMFTMLKEESPSQRIQAVNYVDEIPEPNQEVINALINTLKQDKNVNVRLAAAYSLTRFSENKLVTQAFINALEKETEPILQIVLINILTEKKESKAVHSIQQIISNPSANKEVKEIAKKSVKVLL